MTTNDDMEARLRRVETKIDGLTIQLEEVRDDIKKLGEAYDQGLKEIARQIEDLSRGWQEKWVPHDLALLDHAKRISALERGRKPARRRH